MSKKPKRTTAQFIDALKKIHGDKYDYSLVNYTHKDKNVKIICPIHGEFEKIANSLIQGGGCKKCSWENMPIKSTSYFISKAINVHGDSYDYSSVIYKGKEKKITIICKIHGSFEQSPHNHLSGFGCNECGKIRQANITRKSLTDFIKEANKIHNNKYTYEDVIYKNAITIVNIKCKIHGIFKQRPYAHISGQGCPECSNLLKKTNAPSWTTTNWLNAAKRSKTFDSFKLYVIRCFNETEDFIKIGRTYNTIKRRFSGSQLPYNYEIIKIVENKNGKYIYDLENRVKKMLKKYTYNPIISFGGMNECFKF